MTHQNDYTFSPDLLEELMKQGLDGVTELVQIVVNEAMRVERERYLQASDYERTEDRQGYANGYKPKTVNTRMGEITFAIPRCVKAISTPARWK
jgi:putative transposase